MVQARQLLLWDERWGFDYWGLHGLLLLGTGYRLVLLVVIWVGTVDGIVEEGYLDFSLVSVKDPCVLWHVEWKWSHFGISIDHIAGDWVNVGLFQVKIVVVLLKYFFWLSFDRAYYFSVQSCGLLSQWGLDPHRVVPAHKSWGLWIHNGWPRIHLFINHLLEP